MGPPGAGGGGDAAGAAAASADIAARARGLNIMVLSWIDGVAGRSPSRHSGYMDLSMSTWAWTTGTIAVAAALSAGAVPSIA